MEIKEVVEKCRIKFLNMDNVVGVGIGKKNDNEVIVVMVSSRNNIQIPHKIEQFHVEVREVGEIRAQ